MLARLHELTGVTAEVDRRGELLRLRVPERSAIAGAQQTLVDLGFASVVLTDPVSERVWYGPATVRELSKEEAAVIARRVVPNFAETHVVADRGALTALVSQALYDCFAAPTDPSRETPVAFRLACANAVVAATRDTLGADAASDLGRAIADDLGEAAAGR